MRIAVIKILAGVCTLAAGRALPGNGRFFDIADIHPMPGAPLNASQAWTGGIAGTAALPSPASDELWGKCKCKGEMLTRGMTATDAEAGKLVDPPQDSVQSKFTDFPSTSFLHCKHTIC
jgi:hypothetical protein